MEEQTNVHIDWTCFVSDQFSDKKNLALAQFGNLPDGLFNAGMSDYDLCLLYTSWVSAAQNAGMKGVILTCKHHDGFCLWPTRYTSHSVVSSPWKNGRGDVVWEVSEACRRYGMKFGIYLSPWDRNKPCYGSGKEYDDYYLAQLTELLTGYGDIFSVWLDGACGEGPNGKKQIYDWKRYYECVRKYQPDAWILSLIHI